MSNISAPAMNPSFLPEVNTTPLTEELVWISSFHRRSASSLSAKDMVFTFLVGLSNLITAIPEFVNWTFWKNWYLRSWVGMNVDVSSVLGADVDALVDDCGADSTAAVENQEAVFDLE